MKLSVATAFIVACLLTARAAKQFALNVPQVLLPYVPERNGVKTNFTLKSQKGCFNWISTKPDVAMVTQQQSPDRPSGCSGQAIVTAVSIEGRREKSVILADEQGTSTQLRCDVFVDRIHRIEITTTTRELLLEEAPEMFDVRAFDEENNTFSTLRGLHFEWKLLKDEMAKNQRLAPDDILTFVHFTESGYEADPIISALENQGIHGDSVLVQGTNTGSAVVQVRLMHPSWGSVEPNRVKLIVKENLMLRPYQVIYILPLQYVDYILERRKQGKVEVVQLPSKQYSLELSNETVGSLVSEKSRVIGRQYGHTELRLLDKNTPIDHNVSTDIYVVKPHHIGFKISGNNWVLESGRKYEITVQLFDHTNHQLFMSENIRLDTIIPDTFTVHKSTINGSYFYLEPTSTGHFDIAAHFNRLVNPESGELHNFTEVISGSQPLEVFDPIVVIPDPTVFLWEPAAESGGGKYYTYPMKATGGSGSYVWSCEESEVISIDSGGVVTARMKGSSSVRATDAANSLHYGTAAVHVVPPQKIEFLRSKVEALIGTSILIPIKIMAHIGDKRSLYAVMDCRMTNLKIKSSKVAIFNVSMATNIDLSELPWGSCGALLATASTVGNTKVTVVLENALTNRLDASVTIAAYPELRVVDPTDIAVVALGSSKTFIFEGGPAPWVLDPIHFYENLEPKEKQLNILRIEPNSGLGGQHLFRVVCLKLGDAELVVTIGNGPSPTNQFPANETVSTHISCATPHSMKLRPRISTTLECPLIHMSNRNVEFPILSGHELEVEITVFDEIGRKFDNFSSLEWKWESSNPSYIPHPDTSEMRHHGNHALTTVSPTNQIGSVTLKALSNHYLDEVLLQEGISLESNKFQEISSKLSLLLRREPNLNPERLLLFSHIDNEGALQVVGGSGYFSFDHNAERGNNQLADILRDGRKIKVYPKLEGSFHVHVRDQCLDLRTSLSSEVVISDIYSINVQVADKVQVDHSILACVQILDSHDSAFPTDQYGHMNLKPHPKTPHVTIRPATSMDVSHLSPSKMGACMMYVIKGIVVGTANLYFNATVSSGRIITSVPQEIQVFSPLSLTPKEIWLVPKATFKVDSSGGPYGTDITFSINDSNIASVDESGLITAKVIGDAMVTGESRGLESVTGDIVTFSEGVVYVHVIKLTGVRISVPSTKLLAETEVAVVAHGIHLHGDENPFTFGSAVPGISFHWSVTNMDTLSLVSVYDKVGVSLSEEKDFAARLHTRNTGVGTIHLTAKCPLDICSPDGATFSDQVQIQVLPPLKLLHPQNGYFLLPHQSSSRIMTNRDGSARMSYQLLYPSESDTDMIELATNGLVTTSTINGHAVVMVTAFEVDSGFNQSVSVHVEVCPVGSLSLTPPPTLAQASPNNKYHSFPLGYSADFSADLHDNKGRVFSKSSVSMKYRLNRDDVVRVSHGSNGTVTIRASKQGAAILRVWLSDHTQIDDYIRIRVGYAIMPHSAVVHVGTMICFSTHLTEDHPGTWLSGDEGIVKMQPYGSSVGRAVNTGKAVIYHKVPNIIDTHTEVSVEEVKDIVINSDSLNERKRFTNFLPSSSQSSEGYLVEVTFQRSDNHHFTPLEVTSMKECVHSQSAKYIQQVPFRCHLSLTSSTGSSLPVNSFLRADPYFDDITGRSYCLLRPAEDSLRQSDITRMDSLHLDLQVKAGCFDPEICPVYSVNSNIVSIPFVPAFRLSHSYINLNSITRDLVINLEGVEEHLTGIRVSSSDPSLVSVEKQDFSSFKVSLVGHHIKEFSNVTVRFFSSLSDQELILPVRYTVEEDDSQCPPEDRREEGRLSGVPKQTGAHPSTVSSYMYNILLLLFTVAIASYLIFLLFVCAQRKRPLSSSPPGSKSPTTLPPSGNSPSHQSISPIGPLKASPQGSYTQTQYGGTPFASMATPTSAFRRTSPSSSLKRNMPTSSLPKGPSPVRPLYSSRS